MKFIKTYNRLNDVMSMINMDKIERMYVEKQLEKFSVFAGNGGDKDLRVSHVFETKEEAMNYMIYLGAELNRHQE